MDQSGRHFVLVHGAGHGAWCWYKLATLLKSAGHRVTALDMAASGVHPKQVDELRSMSDYSQPLMEFMESLPADDQVVLVGHSAGGISISVAMERFPEKVSVGAFVASFMHGPDLNLATVFRKFFGVESLIDTGHRYDKGQGKPPTSFLWDPKHMQSKLYNLSPPLVGKSLSFLSPESIAQLLVCHVTSTCIRAVDVKIWMVNPSFVFEMVPARSPMTRGVSSRGPSDG